MDFGNIMLQLEPVLNNIAVAVAIAVLARLGQYLGATKSEMLMQVLHRAMASGVLQASPTVPASVAEQALAYAMKSVPGTIAKIGPAPGVLMDLALAKVRELAAQK